MKRTVSIENTLIMMLLLLSLALRQQVVNVKSSAFRSVKLLDACSLVGLIKNEGYYIDEECETFMASSNIFQSFDALDYSGGALYLENIKKLTIFNNSFIEIRAMEGGAIYSYSINEINSTANDYNKCSAVRGGCLYFRGNSSSINITGDVFTDSCSNISGGSIFFNKTVGSANIDQCSFVNSKGKGFGGACFIMGLDNIEIKNCNFIRCSIEHEKGGALYFSTLNSVRSIKNIYNDCYANANGGAIYLFAIKTMNEYQPSLIDGDQFNGCHSNEYGGAIYGELSPLLFIEIDSTKFINCYTSDEVRGGGGIYMKKIKSIGFDKIECNSCYSNAEGGFMYAQDILSEINVKRSIFNNLDASTGGAFCLDESTTSPLKSFYYIQIMGCKFYGCNSFYTDGGAIYITNCVSIAAVHSSSFKNCRANFDGAAFHYQYSDTTEKIEFNFLNNNFEDCKSGTKGTVNIVSTRVDSSYFIYNNFTNCSTTNDKGQGGGFIATVSSYYDFNFISCHFSSCNATYKYGALGFVITFSSKDSKISNLTLKGCTFENCSSGEASCIGTLTPKFGKNSLVIDGDDESYSVFRSLGGKNNFAIVTDVSNVTIKKTLFDRISSGIIQSIKQLKMNDCHFTNCSSAYSLINCTALTELDMQEMTFTNCDNCFLLKSSGIATISSLAISDSSDSSTSSIDAQQITISDLNLQNNEEQINLVSKGNISINRGSFNNSNKIISVTGTNTINVKSLNIWDSLMFEIKQFEEILIDNCNISYKSNEKIEGMRIIATNSNFEIRNCNFTTSNIALIEQVNESTSNLIDGCIFIGENSPIYVGGIATIKNSDFELRGKIFNISEASGKIKLHENSNCFRNKDFEEVFGKGKVTDQGGIKLITEFNETNNLCKALPASSEFSYSQIFKQTNEFSLSTVFDATKDFSFSQLFKKTSDFSYSKVFEKTNEFSFSKKFDQSSEFSNSLKYEPTNEFTHSMTLIKSSEEGESSNIQFQTTNHEIANDIPSSINQEDALTTKPIQTSNEHTQEANDNALTSAHDEDKVKFQTSQEHMKPEPIGETSPTKHNVLQTTIDKNRRGDAPGDKSKDIDKIMTTTNDIPEANVANNVKSDGIGVIAGAAVGSVVVIIIIIIVIIVACRNRNYELDETSNDCIETEFETGDSSSTIVFNEFNTSYVTQEMPTSTWTNANMMDEDFLGHEESD